MTRRHALVAFATLAGALAACARSSPDAPTPVPDDGRRLAARNGVVTSAHPLASDAGVEMLRRGGNAVDAAVAAGFAIGVVEPQMSGVGGSGAMLLWRERERRAEYSDFYAAQPAASFRAAGVTRADSAAPMRIVAVPGLVAGLLDAHAKYGKLPREVVLAPAIRYAAEGFPVYQTLAEFIVRDTVRLGRDPEARALLSRDGRWLEAGDRLVNPRLAEVLRAVAARGREGFYSGATADALLARLSAGKHPATPADFPAFAPEWKRPLCATYRGRVLLSAPPPQGGMQLLHTLKLLEQRDVVTLGTPVADARAFDVFASALRAGTQGARLSDDPRWRQVPARGATSDGYARARATLVGSGRAADSLVAPDARPFESEAIPAQCAPFAPRGPVTSASPAGGAASGPPEGHDGRGGETTHISVVDADGHAVALTVTNSSAFGAGVAVSGFFLNDSGVQSIPGGSGGAAWRTRTSTIAPTMIFEGNRLQVIVGSPGGGRIPLAMAQVISYVADYRMDPLDAVRMPRLYTTGAGSKRVELEHGFAPEVLEGIRAMGYVPVEPGFGYARLYLIARRGDAWVGAADPRHDGRVRGY